MKIEAIKSSLAEIQLLRALAFTVIHFLMKNLPLLLLLLPCLAFSQTKSYVSINPIYIRNVDAADQFFEDSLFQEAVPFYLNALQITEEAFRPKYRLATCYLHEREFASANAWLQKCAKQHPKDCCELVLDEASDLYKYRPFLDWWPLQTTCAAAMPKFDSRLKAELVEVQYFDQFIRTEHRLPNEADCAGSPYYWPGMSYRQVDSVNEVRLAAILEKLGEYPGNNIVGMKQRSSAWLVIQHAPIEFQERFYPLVEKAVDEGQLARGDWAYLVDRMRMNRGEKQVYGSQMRQKADGSGYEIYPLEDPFHVNERRAEMGLGAIEEYIEHWGIKFEPEKMQRP
jgi:hypothetical protein